MIRVRFFQLVKNLLNNCDKEKLVSIFRQCEIRDKKNSDVSHEVETLAASHVFPLSILHEYVHESVECVSTLI